MLDRQQTLGRGLFCVVRTNQANKSHPWLIRSWSILNILYVSGLKWLYILLQRRLTRQTGLRPRWLKHSIRIFLLCTLSIAGMMLIIQLRKTWTPTWMWLIKGIPKRLFPVSSSELWAAHINQFVTIEIHYSVSYLCHQRRESALLLFLWCHFPLRGKVYLLSAGSHRNRTSAPGSRMFPSLSSMRYSDEDLKMSLTCLGSHYSSE